MFKTLETIPKVIAWLQIAVAPAIVGGAVGFFIYTYYPNSLGLILAILTAIVGVVFGIVWANRVANKRGLVEHMSRVIATSEFDHQEEESN
mgnify:CR=1 FL=1